MVARFGLLAAPSATRLWFGALMLLAAADGLVAGARPQLAIFGALGIAFAVLVLTNPTAGLCLFVLVSFLDVLPQTSGGVTLVKSFGLLLAASWLLATLSRRDRLDRTPGLIERHPGFVAALVGLLAWTLLSMLWAEQAQEAAATSSRFALNFALFPIALAAMRTPRQVTALFASFVVGALLAATWALLSPTSNPSDSGRLSGDINPNALGRILLVAIVLAAALAAMRSLPRLARAAAVVAAGICAAGLFATVSRGALVGLCVAAIVAPLAAGYGRRGATLAVVVAGMLVALVLFALIAPAGAVSRVVHPAAGGGAGREDLWKIGWRMVEAHPIRGIGAGNFPNTSVHYLLRPGDLLNKSTPAFVIDTPKVPHNLYLQVLAETGTVGLLLFVGVVGFALLCSLSAARAFQRGGDRDMEVLARGLFVATAGLLAANFFASELFNKQLWLVLAAGPALRLVAERLAAPP